MSDDRFICIDIGYSKITAALVDSDIDQKLEVLAVTEAPACGLYRGTVKEVEAVSGSIRQAVTKLFETLDPGKIDRVIVGITGMDIEGVNSTGSVSIKPPQKTITEWDIEAAIDNAKAVRISLDRQIFLVGQQQFVIDEKIISSNPIKMAAKSLLQAQVHLLTCLENIRENFERCLIDAGIERFQLSYSGVAGAQAILSEQEKDLGTLYIDIGKETIDVLFFKNRCLHYSKVYSYGCGLITNDLCYIFHTSYDDAEALKEEGTAYPLTDVADTPVYVRGLKGAEPKTYRQHEINEVIEARVIWLLKTIAADFHKSNTNELKFGIVLAGGGAQQLGIEQCAKQIFGTSVRIAEPDTIKGFGAFQTPRYASVYGLICSNQTSGLLFDGKEEGRTLRRKRSYRRPGGLFSGIAEFFRSFL